MGEGWLSGRKRIPAKDVCSYATWVRIPFLPFLNVTKHYNEKLEKNQLFFDYKRKKNCQDLFVNSCGDWGKCAIQPLWLALRVGTYTYIPIIWYLYTYMINH